MLERRGLQRLICLTIRFSYIISYCTQSVDLQSIYKIYIVVVFGTQTFLRFVRSTQQTVRIFRTLLQIILHAVRNFGNKAQFLQQPTKQYAYRLVFFYSYNCRRLSLAYAHYCHSRYQNSLCYFNLVKLDQVIIMRCVSYFFLIAITATWWFNARLNNVQMYRTAFVLLGLPASSQYENQGLIHCSLYVIGQPLTDVGCLATLLVVINLHGCNCISQIFL